MDGSAQEILHRFPKSCTYHTQLSRSLMNCYRQRTHLQTGSLSEYRNRLPCMRSLQMQAVGVAFDPLLKT